MPAGSPQSIRLSRCRQDQPNPTESKAQMIHPSPFLQAVSEHLRRIHFPLVHFFLKLQSDIILNAPVHASLKVLTWFLSQFTFPTPSYSIPKVKVGVRGLCVFHTPLCTWVNGTYLGHLRVDWWDRQTEIGGEVRGGGGEVQNKLPGAPVKPGCQNINTTSLPCKGLP